ncbi:MAG: tetratricopeptide repeat protein [Chloroflexota bacterium]
MQRTRPIERKLAGRQPTFHPSQRTNNFYRLMIMLLLITAGIWTYLRIERGQITSPFEPTPTPTRVSASYFQEAQAYFEAGKLDVVNPPTPGPGTPGPSGPVINDAIDAYKAALQGDPNNASAWAELARIQTHSTSMLPNDTERLQRLKEAKASADRAVELGPDNSTARAIRAFALDWYAFNTLVPKEEREAMLVEAEREASRAYQLDPDSALALAFYAEVLADQSKWTQAEKYAAQAVARDPESMDAHRVYGYVLETLGAYNSAIQQYQEATRINPNMTSIYVRIGQNYREGIRNPDLALEYFDRAAKINEALGVPNSLPYIEIARTYTQIGQFFAASINAEKALKLDTSNAQTYGQLGIIFRRARNYEGAMGLLQCAVVGCTAEENEMGKVAVEGLPLTSITVAYYYVEYGTNLAFLSRRTENYCPQARRILQQVRQSYSSDPTLMSIVEDSEGICSRLDSEAGANAAPTSATPVITGTPASTLAPMVTPTPAAPGP